MEIDKKRSEIPCYWENQPVGCQKLNCAFHHNKGRFVDGLFLPPSKTVIPNVSESTEEEIKATQISLQQNKLSVQSNPSPQLRGVMKVENSENVPSPTHPPVVINAADDDEDDDDQLSEEGDESKIPVQQPSADISNGLRVISTRKLAIGTKQDKDTLNFGIKTLEEIKSKKIKEKSKKQSDKPSQVAFSLAQAQAQAHPDTEKNVRTVIRTVTLSAKSGEEPRIQLSLTERLGKRKPSLVMDSGIPLKRSLAERLGKKIESPEIPDKTTKRVQVPKSLKERLGLPAEQNNVETENAAKPGGEIRVKTLEEIRLEKASQRKEEAQPKPRVEAACPTDDLSPVAKATPVIRIKTFSEVIAEKKQRQQEEERIRTDKESLIKPNCETEPQKQGSPVPAISGRRKLEEPSGKAKDFGEVRIKTLEEIKQEKALRMQQGGEITSKAQKQPEQTPAGRKLLCITKPTAMGREEKKLLELKTLPRTSPVDASTKTLDDSVSSSHSQVHVKSLEEIRKEKQLKQQQERKPQEEQTSVSSAGEKKTQGKSPVMANTDVAATTGNTRPLSKRLLVRSQEAVTENMGFEDLGLSAQPMERRAKAKPKVNVKPSGVKRLSPAKQALKRKATESQSSAIAAVKPLSPIPSSDTKNLPSENMAVICVPRLPEDTAAAIPEGVNCNSSELNVDNQVATTLQAETATSTSSHAAKTRRLSSTGTGKTPASVEDDFEKLIWEISGGKLEAEIDLDPGKDEDDLLLELSEMIDS